MPWSLIHFGCKGIKIYLDIKAACSFFLILHRDLRKKEQAGGELGGKEASYVWVRGVKKKKMERCRYRDDVLLFLVLCCDFWKKEQAGGEWNGEKDTSRVRYEPVSSVSEFKSSISQTLDILIKQKEQGNKGARGIF